MHLAITLGSHRAWWQFHGSAPFGTWLGARPWLVDGGLVLLTSGGPLAADLLGEALGGAVHGADAGASGVRVLPLDTARADAGFVSCLAETLGLVGSPRLREFAAKVSDALAGPPCVFTARLVEAPSVKFLTEAAELRDLLGKLPARCALTVILLASSPTRAVSAVMFDFTTGRPVEAVLAHMGGAEAAPWSVYLHHRIAWECAGNLELALAWESEPVTAALAARVGDDEMLEQIFGRWADRHLSSLDAVVRRAWLDFAAGSAPQPGVDASSHWQPEPGDSSRPQPWLARALLRAGAQGAARWMLRSGLNCRILTTAILSRCLEFEATLLSRHAGALLGAASSLNGWTRERHQRYLTGVRALHYPAAHPAPPNSAEDAWLFASLGEIVSALNGQLAPGVVSAYSQLVALRNDLAHGHHPGWVQWRTIWQLGALFP